MLTDSGEFHIFFLPPSHAMRARVREPHHRRTVAANTLAGATRAQTPVDRKVSERRNSSAAEAVPNTVQSAQLAAQIHRKLNTIIIPAIAFLRKRSVDLDTTEPDPAKRGVNIVLNIAIRLPPLLVPPARTSLKIPARCE